MGAQRQRDLGGLVLTVLRSAMNSSMLAGCLEMPASCSTSGLYQRMLDRWMFTGTE